MRQVFRAIGIKASIVDNIAARSCQSSFLDLALTKPMYNESVYQERIEGVLNELSRVYRG